MMKMIHKRALSLLLSIMLIVTILPTTALAATKQGISYLGLNGTPSLADDVTVIDSGSTTLNSGWYLVDSGNVTINQTVTVNGDVKLILEDGANLTVNGAGSASAGINVTQGNSLSIYAQSIGSGMGRLTARGSGNGTGIGSADHDQAGAISIYGGRITATGGSGGAGAAGIGDVAGASDHFGTIDIYGGFITATAGGVNQFVPDIGGSGDSTDSILIQGGTIVSKRDQGQIVLGVNDVPTTMPKITIDGGSVNIGAFTARGSDPIKNSAGKPVPLSADTLTVPGQANAAVASVRIDGALYGSSLYTDGNGKLYLHPAAYASKVPVVVTMDDGTKYWGVYQPTGDFPPETLTLANTEENPLSPGKATFLAFAPEDITVYKMDSDHTFSGIRNGATSLVADQDYTVNGDNVTIKKEYLATLPAGVTTLTFSGVGSGSAALPVTVYIAPEYVALGDSIATGYGLPGYNPAAGTPPSGAYTSTVGNTLHLSSGFLAQDGEDSQQLLSMLSDPQTKAYLSKAKVLTLSIGADDILLPFLQTVAQQLDCDPDQITAQLAALSQSNPTALAAALSALNADDGTGLKNNQALTDAASGFAQNFQRIISALKAAAPNAKIYVTNVYNPYEGISIPYGASTLNLGAIADGYIHTLNSAFSTSSADYKLIDTYSAFSESEVSLANADLSTFNFDPHPNAAGHAKIADMILAAYSESPKIETSSLPGYFVGGKYDQTLKATGSAPITWSLQSGALPSGLTLDSATGRISGTASAPGNFSFTVKATTAAETDSRAFSITIDSVIGGGVSWGNLIINQLSQNSTAASVSSVATGVLSLPLSDQSRLAPKQVANLEELMKTTLGAAAPSIPVPVTTGFSSISALPPAPPVVTGLILATWGGGSATLTTTQVPNPNIPGAQLAFDLSLTASGTPQPIHSRLGFPVTVTIMLPSDFIPKPGSQYLIRHTLQDGSSELLQATIGGTAGQYTATFTTVSFSTFTLIKTDAGSSSGSHHSSGVSVSNPEVMERTFISDTNADFSVNGAYQFKITSQNGAAPLLTVGTPGVFETQLVRTSGNDYFYKLTSVGKAGEKAGIYVNGVKLLAATVETATAPVKSDTTAPFQVPKGKPYTFKLTADRKPVFVSGNSSVFLVKFIRQSGKDYFYQVTAVGKPGQTAGFYLNASKRPVAIAAIA